MILQQGQLEYQFFHWFWKIYRAMLSLYSFDVLFDCCMDNSQFNLWFKKTTNVSDVCIKPEYNIVVKFKSRSNGLTMIDIPDSKVHGTNMGPTWVLSAPDGPHVGPMNLIIRNVVACTKYKSRVSCQKGPFGRIPSKCQTFKPDPIYGAQTWSSLCLQMP